MIYFVNTYSNDFYTLPYFFWKNTDFGNFSEILRMPEKTAPERIPELSYRLLFSVNFIYFVSVKSSILYNLS